ncbi:hypothetical protein E2562_022798 [Oryza meyeriana var. granulata]|uniref:Uncharacterized protein n=1 Tax=Oryza meyeriana var. granulata TaxID=110450 RepID=A0A6G1EY74_9ORYZ|nr:hypothetical protein E2562_022798 [Oryza meyeriana var. granulata]
MRSVMSVDGWPHSAMPFRVADSARLCKLRDLGGSDVYSSFKEWHVFVNDLWVGMDELLVRWM